MGGAGFSLLEGGERGGNVFDVFELLGLGKQVLSSLRTSSPSPLHKHGLDWMEWEVGDALRRTNERGNVVVFIAIALFWIRCGFPQNQNKSIGK